MGRGRIAQCDTYPVILVPVLRFCRIYHFKVLLHTSCNRVVPIKHSLKKRIFNWYWPPYKVLLWARICVAEDQVPVLISNKTSYRKISQSLDVTRSVFRIVRSLWNLTGTSAELLPMCLLNFKAMRRFKQPISRIRDSRDPTVRRLIGCWNGAL